MRHVHRPPRAPSVFTTPNPGVRTPEQLSPAPDYQHPPESEVQDIDNLCRIRGEEEQRRNPKSKETPKTMEQLEKEKAESDANWERIKRETYNGVTVTNKKGTVGYHITTPRLTNTVTVTLGKPETAPKPAPTPVPNMVPTK